MTGGSAGIGIVTGEDWPELPDSAQLLADELENRDHHVDPVIWDDETEDWGAFDLLVIRSCFGYYRTPSAFRDWLDQRAEAETTVVNPVPVLQWNMHKFYLRELIEAGVDVLETAFVRQGEPVELAEILRSRDWDRAVVKPAIATSSADAWLTNHESAGTDQDRFVTALSSGDHLVQAFAPEIADGERSLVFIDGEFSHAWRSIPAEDEFRSHRRFGGTSETYDPPAWLREQAGSVLETALEVTGQDVASAPGFAYARVDGIKRDGRFVLMELELVEPFLGLHRSSGAPARLADAVLNRL